METQPWKNGGGVTREIAARRADESLLWRLSIADVESGGPFSNFAGLTRILTVIEGNGLELIGKDSLFLVQYGVPVQFSGALEIMAKLINGPIRDVNVMFDPNLCHGDVVLAKAPLRKELEARGHRTYAVIGLKGKSRISAIQVLEFGDTALIEHGSTELVLEDEDVALILTLDLIG